MEKHKLELDTTEMCVLLGCVHIGKHLWQSGHDEPDAAEKTIKALEKKVRDTMPDDPVKMAGGDEPVEEAVGEFLALSTACDLLDQIFISGALSVAMGRELKEALGSLKGFPLALPNDPNDKEVLH